MKRNSIFDWKMMSTKTEKAKMSAANNAAAATASDRELILTRVIDPPREKLFRAWTEPWLLKQWFAPVPFTTPVAELDVRPGGANFIVMRGPDGVETPHRGVYLEVVQNARLVFTNAFAKAWEPVDLKSMSIPSFLTFVLTFDDAGGGKTKYTACLLHWTAADREQHEQMGFHQGWGQCTNQLAALVESMKS
jgi:uncharacterized protein YndB with AHSA1/START domain